MCADIRNKLLQVAKAITMHDLDLSYVSVNRSGRVMLFQRDFDRLFENRDVGFETFDGSTIAYGNLHGIDFECVRWAPALANGLPVEDGS